MKKVEITIDGESYPCTPTMGAMVRFEKETGRDISEINPGKVSDLCMYLYCSVAAAANKSGKTFDMSFEDFADRITPDDMAAWNNAISTDKKTEDESVDGSKKK